MVYLQLLDGNSPWGIILQQAHVGPDQNPVKRWEFFIVPMKCSDGVASDCPKDRSGRAPGGRLAAAHVRK